MANGTGLTAGPFSVSAGTTGTYNDPNAQGGQTSDRVQVQNQSGFTLTVFSSGAPYTIPALQASTIPAVPGGQSIEVETGAIGTSSAGGSFSLIWLLPGQDSPIPDGPLTLPSVNGSIVLDSESWAGLPGFSRPVSIPASIQTISLTLIVGDIGGSTGAWTLTVVGAMSGQIYLSKSGTGPTTVTYVFSVLSQIDSVVTVTFSGTYSGAIAGGSWTLTGLYSPAATDSVTYGGLISLTFTGLANGSTASLLAAPGTGIAYRLHSWSLNQALTAGVVSLRGPGGAQFYATQATPGGTQYLGGRLITTALSVYNNATGATVGGELGYDLVLIPSIS